MISYLKVILIVYVALLVQGTILPAYLADPFKPNLLILALAYLGLRQGGWYGALLAFLLGLIADCFNGLYLGLSAFSFLSVHLLLRKLADRLYTDSLYLMVLVVFAATLVNGLIHLVLLLLFSVAPGAYTDIFAGLLPQALVNALMASLLFGIPAFSPREEAR